MAKLDKVDVRKIFELQEKGYKVVDIARIFGVSRQAIYWRISSYPQEDAKDSVKDL